MKINIVLGILVVAVGSPAVARDRTIFVLVAPIDERDRELDLPQHGRALRHRRGATPGGALALLPGERESQRADIVAARQVDRQLAGLQRDDGDFARLEPGGHAGDVDQICEVPVDLRGADLHGKARQVRDPDIYRGWRRIVARVGLGEHDLVQVERDVDGGRHLAATGEDRRDE